MKETTKSLLHLQCENYMSYVIHHHTKMPEKEGMKCHLYSVSEIIMPHLYTVILTHCTLLPHLCIFQLTSYFLKERTIFKNFQQHFLLLLGLSLSKYKSKNFLEKQPNSFKNLSNLNYFQKKIKLNI